MEFNLISVLLISLLSCNTKSSEKEALVKNDTIAYEQIIQKVDTFQSLQHSLFTGIAFSLNNELVYIAQDSSRTLNKGDTLISFVNNKPEIYQVTKIGACDDLIEGTGGFADCILYPQGVIGKLISNSVGDNTSECYNTRHPYGEIGEVSFLFKEKNLYKLTCEESELSAIINIVGAGYQEVENSSLEIDMANRKMHFLSHDTTVQEDVDIEVEACYEVNKNFYFLISFSRNEYTFSYILFYDGESLRKIYEYPIA